MTYSFLLSWIEQLCIEINCFHDDYNIPERKEIVKRVENNLDPLTQNQVVRTRSKRIQPSALMRSGLKKPDKPSIALHMIIGATLFHFRFQILPNRYLSYLHKICCFIREINYK